ncbi:hypothetical protein FDO65_04670 [Nakamurella flava]|uniref:Uncharacterized protein n=1 Tax=Nakamurella flava TaxID=2576308 RepID=A0A4U6QKH3_9ACTN|nr:putative Ig domain-containing protein [Nakamurella flava]TKV60953.1 hypothetical protein FDO65_04670 [Nakamurella flava]
MLILSSTRRRVRPTPWRRAAAALTAVVTALAVTVVAAPAAFAADQVGSSITLPNAPKAIATSGDTAWFTSGSLAQEVTGNGSTLGRIVSVGAGAQGIGFAPDGKLWVTNGDAGTVSVYDTTTLTRTKRIVLPIDAVPYDIAFGSDGTAYVVNKGKSTVSVIAPNARSVTRTIPLPTDANPNAIAVGPDNTVYTSNFSPDTISMIAPGSTSVTKTIATGSGPRDILAGPDGTVYVAYWYDPNNVVSSGVKVYDSTLDNERSIPMANTVKASALAMSAGGTLYVAQYSPDKIAVVPGVPASLTVTGSLAMAAPASGPTSLGVLSNGTVLAGSTYQHSDLTRWNPLAITTSSLPRARVDVDYAVTLGVTGGQSPYSWSVASGTLPAGLSLNASTGIISGRPTTANASQVPNVALRVTDSAGVSVDAVYQLLVERIPTSLALQSSAGTELPFGQPVTLTATIDPVSAAGQIHWYAYPTDGTPRTDLGTSTLSSSGSATWTGTLPGFGGFQLSAVYLPSSTDRYSASDRYTQVIQSRATPGQLTVTKFHPSAAENADWFVEFTNTTSTAIPVSTVRLSLGGTTAALAGSVEPGRRFVVAGQGGAYAAVADQTVNLASGPGVSLTAADGYNQTPATTLDAVGTAAGPHSGTALPAYMSADVPTASAWVRNVTFAGPVNTGQNAGDFQLVSADGGTVGGLPAVAGNAQPVGTANPLLLSARTAPSGLLDPSKSAAAEPNRVVVQQSGATRLVVNRVITNNTGRQVNRMALQINTLSQPNAPVPSGVTGQTAWLRPVNPSSPTQQIVVNGQPVTVQRLSVASGTGAGLGSMLTVPLPEEGLAPGATVAVQLTFAVDRPGKFWFSYLAMTS